MQWKYSVNDASTWRVLITKNDKEKFLAAATADGERGIFPITDTTPFGWEATESLTRLHKVSPETKQGRALTNFAFLSANRIQCSGTIPCASCVSKGCQCIYGSDRRRKSHKIESSKLHQALLYTLVKLRSRNPDEVKSFILEIRGLQNDQDGASFLLRKSRLEYQAAGFWSIAEWRGKADERSGSGTWVICCFGSFSNWIPTSASYVKQGLVDLIIYLQTNEECRLWLQFRKGLLCKTNQFNLVIFTHPLFSEQINLS